MTATLTRSLAADIAALPEAELEAMLRGFSASELAALEYDWRFWARPSQLPPDGEWAFWLVLAGRGFGKTRTGAEYIRDEVDAGRAHRVAMVAPTAGDARDVMVEGESGLLAISPPWNRPTYEPSKRRITWSNGAIATLYSADEPERLRGPQHDLAWADEVAAWRYEEAYDQLMFGLRLGTRPRVVFTTTPKPTALIKALVKDPTGVVTRGSTYDNRANLAATFFSKIVAKYEGTRLGRQELRAEVLEDVEGALWSLAQIEEARMSEETFKSAPVGRTVVAIDPNVSKEPGADEAGVLAVMRGAGQCPCGKSDCAYVLQDASGNIAPIEWARAAVGLYTKYSADRVIAEVNNGGDLVETQLRVVDQNVSYKGVHAAKGKRTRAEPVQALYEQGRVHHVGSFPQLEDQMTQWVPDMGLPSPGRMDALVWGLTELMLDDSAGLLDYYAAQAAAQRAAEQAKREAA